MSKYNLYAQRVNEHAKANFEAFLKAKAEFEAAESHYNANRRPNGLWFADAEKIATVAEAEANYARKKAAYEAAKRAFSSSSSKIAEISAELKADIEAGLSANPDDLDGNTLELLKSGILKPAEYSSLLDRFSSNPTMTRLIGSYAENRAKVDGLPAAERGALYGAVQKARQANNGDKLEAMDYLSTLYDKCINNPAMIGHWEELSTSVVENF